MSREFPTATSTFSFQNESLADELSPQEEQNSWIAFGLLVAATVWGYGNTLIYNLHFWSEPLYSHGWIIPGIAGAVFWARRKPLVQVPALDRWIGVAVLLAFLSLRIFAASIMNGPLENTTFVGCLLGCAMIVGGWPLLKWAGPPIAFLVFMFKFPSFVEHTVLLKLQQWASMCSTWTLQTIGVSAIRDGNRIQIAGLEQGLEVADACSGLRMSTIFGAMSIALAMIVNRPWWDRLTILVFAIPIALLTNIIRITVTALIFMMFPDSDGIHDFVHSSAGWAMMPVAMGFLWVELQLLNHISVPIEDETQYTTFGTVGA